MNSKELIHRYLLGNVSDEEMQQLDRLLATDSELRQEFLLAAGMDAGLREVAIERSLESENHVAGRRSSRHWWNTAGWSTIAVGLAVAATLLLAVGVWWRHSATVATLASSENAAWESALPTSPGAELMAGTLDLKAGVATIRFRSGAEVVLEAPAQLELMSAMRGKLHSGAAVVDVPESAVGFVLETPDAYAIDFGTRFAVRIDREKDQADFELIEGEIEVHHAQSGEFLRLNAVGETAAASSRSVQLVDPLLDDDVEPEMDMSVLRIGTQGRCATVMPRFHKRHKYIDPEVLSVKHTNSGRFEFRSFFSFDLTGVDLGRVRGTRLRLNLVPSRRGLASRLPKINRFGVYGLTNPDKANWKIESTWEEAPAPEDGVLLGTFEIPRSQRRGTFGIETDELLKFLQHPRGGPVTLILVRETTQVEGVGPGLTHMFASDEHPESVGPLLELSIQ